MSKFDIGDSVVIADPAYLVIAGDAQGYVSPDAYGKPATVLEVIEEGDRDDIIGTAYRLKIGTLFQTVSQHYLTAAPEPVKPTLADGVYRTKDQGQYSDTVLVKGSKVIEVLIAGDNCEPSEHLPFYQKPDFDAATLVRLVAPEAPPRLPEDGIYVDSEGDIVQIKDGEARDLQSSFGTVFDVAYFDEANYGPYTPVVTETEAAAK